MRALTVLPVACVLTTGWFVGVLLLLSPPVQFSLLIAASVLVGAGIGVLVRPPRVAAAVAAAALGVGAFLGAMAFGVSIFLEIGGTSYWWTAEVGISLIQGTLHGSIAAFSAGATSVTLHFLGPRKVETAEN